MLKLFISILTLVVVAGPVQSKSKDPQLKSLLKVSEQADAIVREAMWVVNDERPARGKTPFGRLNRALQLEVNGRITNKGLLGCEKYLLKKNIQSASGYPVIIEILQKCREKESAKSIVEIKISKEQAFDLVFMTENLGDTLGLGASIFGKKIDCHIETNADDIIQIFSCRQWHQDRGDGKIVKLDTFDYNYNDQNLLKLRGQVLENLNPIRKIVSDVPLQGKIIVTETVLDAPPEKIQKKNPVEVKKKATALDPNHQGAPAVDADLIQQQIQQGQGSHDVPPPTSLSPHADSHTAKDLESVIEQHAGSGQDIEDPRRRKKKKPREHVEPEFPVQSDQTGEPEFIQDSPENIESNENQQAPAER